MLFETWNNTAVFREKLKIYAWRRCRLERTLPVVTETKKITVAGKTMFNFWFQLYGNKASMMYTICSPCPNGILRCAANHLNAADSLMAFLFTSPQIINGEAKWYRKCGQRYLYQLFSSEHHISFYDLYTNCYVIYARTRPDNVETTVWFPFVDITCLWFSNNSLFSNKSELFLPLSWRKATLLRFYHQFLQRWTVEKPLLILISSTDGTLSHQGWHAWCFFDASLLAKFPTLPLVPFLRSIRYLDSLCGAP